MGDVKHLNSDKGEYKNIQPGTLRPTLLIPLCVHLVNAAMRTASSENNRQIVYPLAVPPHRAECTGTYKNTYMVHMYVRVNFSNSL